MVLLKDLAMTALRRDGTNEAARQKGGLYGLGYLLATAVFALGYQSGCRKAEILAINDNGVCLLCLLYSE